MSKQAVYTHGHAASVLRSHSNRNIDNSAAYLAPELQPGLCLLDVGSGPGTITADFAKRLRQGEVTAVETTPDALALTQKECERQGVTNVVFSVGDAQALPFDDDSFDVVHAHQVLQHLGDPVQALREMRRVCKPGGVVACRDADYDGFIWYPASAALDEWRRLYKKAAYANGGEPNAGRFLLSWAQEAGFTQITPSSSTWCVATPAAREWWGGMWEKRILESRIADQLLDAGWASQGELQAISRAWGEWRDAADGWLSVPHGEILCRV